MCAFFQYWALFNCRSSFTAHILSFAMYNFEILLSSDSFLTSSIYSRTCCHAFLVFSLFIYIYWIKSNFFFIFASLTVVFQDLEADKTYFIPLNWKWSYSHTESSWEIEKRNQRRNARWYATVKLHKLYISLQTAIVDFPIHIFPLHLQLSTQSWIFWLRFTFCFFFLLPQIYVCLTKWMWFRYYSINKCRRYFLVSNKIYVLLEIWFMKNADILILWTRYTISFHYIHISIEEKKYISVN